jgi:2-C-methyl-D-erythritol 2,4-cyclodiphosphate synthase|uniref:2-C-methyl-D-erythritol 2,4-cyclodiphosphate synthase n=1 Tax=Desulfomonile tiedjei TaxID=2358 RepID=A0A7C4AT10_9BACT
MRYTSQHSVPREEIVLRIGQGFDFHALKAGRRLVLGGIVIDYDKGLEGHSDADVLTHAIIDALLGGAGLGDIGMHFPDDDPSYKDANSIDLLKEVCLWIRNRGFEVSNVDATVFAQEPKLSPYRQAIEEKLATAMGIAPDCMNLKATTTERLGFVGRGEGIGSSAAALLRPAGGAV